MKLQEKIYYCRKKAGYSQEALAEQLGVSRQAISKWENGDAEPEISKLRLLAQAFDVTADWLLTDEEPEEPYEKERVIYSTYGSDSNSNSNSNWVESVPGVLGKLIKRYGWLFGVYVAVAGASFAFVGGLMRYMARSFFSSFSVQPSFDPQSMLSNFMEEANFDGQSMFSDKIMEVDAFSDSIYSSVSTVVANNPIYTMGSIAMILGIVIMIIGIILAIVLKKNSNKAS